MARYADEPAAVPKLVKLSNSGLRLQDRASNVRGLGVFARNGEQTGSVEHFYVDTVSRSADVRTPG
jgi:hypothetical protein